MKAEVPFYAWFVTSQVGIAGGNTFMFVVAAVMCTIILAYNFIERRK